MAADVIRLLQDWFKEVGWQANEAGYQAQLAIKLNELDIKFNRDRLHDALGYGQPDALVTSTDPFVLIELKPDGDWRHVAEAAVQLFGLSHRVSERYSKSAVSLALFGAPLQHVFLSDFLVKLDIQYACRG